jgi:hypothetical protein
VEPGRLMLVERRATGSAWRGSGRPSVLEVRGEPGVGGDVKTRVDALGGRRGRRGRSPPSDVPATGSRGLGCVRVSGMEARISGGEDEDFHWFMLNR